MRLLLLQALHKAYLRHLINAGEMLGATLLSLHNITFLARLMKGLREAILHGGLRDFCREFYAKYGQETPSRL